MYFQKQLQEAVSVKLGELYITRREEHICQKNNGEYSWRKWFKLHDLRLTKHLNGEETIGIFARELSSKVLIFDVDTKENAEVDTRHLVNTLVYNFNIAREDIHIVFSGSKGYHVTLYFTNLIGLKLLKRFYLSVLAEAGFTTTQIEMRPLFKSGVKLPLGINKKSGKRCWFVNNQTFKEIKSFYHIFKVTKIDAEDFALRFTELFTEEITFLSQDQKSELALLHSNVKLDDNSKLYYAKNINNIIQSHSLLRANTRNEATLFLAMYLKNSLGYSKSQCISEITSIMLNTKLNKPNFINSSENEIKYKTKAVVNCVYRNNYKINASKRDVYITKEEIIHLLSIKKWNAKLLYFVHLVQSKRYSREDNTYYLSYNQIREMLGDTFTSQQAISNNLKYLVDNGYIQVVKKGYLDFQSKVGVATTYKLAKNFDFSDENILIESNSVNFNLNFEEFLLRIQNNFNLNVKKLLITRSQKEKLTKYAKERGL